MSKEVVFPESGLKDRALGYQHTVCVVATVHQAIRRALGQRRQTFICKFSGLLKCLLMSE